MLNARHTFQLPLIRTHPPTPRFNTFFSEILRTGALPSPSEGEDRSADKQPRCEESSFLFFTLAIIKSFFKTFLFQMEGPGLQREGKKDTCGFPECIFSTASPPSPAPMLFVYLWSGEAVFQGRMTSSGAVEKYFVFCFSSFLNDQILLCHSPNGDGHCLRVWEELTDFQIESEPTSYFSFCY